MWGFRFLTACILAAAALLPAACAPTMPTYPVPRDTGWLDQGWTPEQRDWYHNADQGTLTFGIPYEWFVALEQPVASLTAAPLLRDKAWLDRFGFIPGNSDLPVGFARGSSRPDPATGVNYSGVGLTCAACHTGRMTHNGTEILIDGGSALTDVVNFNKSLVLAMTYTKYVPFRFQRFASRVLGPNASEQAKDSLRDQVGAAVSKEFKVVKLELDTEGHAPPEGFGRLDAINRIGNRVFGLDMDTPANYVARSAPVHYPHIWTAPWFTWVQYNGSIMQPMVRNAGEALGVGATMSITGTGGRLFESSVRIPQLQKIEHTLAGDHPLRAKGFSGLRSPVWPTSLPPIDGVLAAKGAGLYQELCQGCHLPALGTKEFWSGKWWTRIGGTGDKYLDLVQIPITEIGTDPEQAVGMATRTVKLPEGFSTLPENMKFKSNGFGLALGQLVQNVATSWYESQTPPIPAKQQNEMNGGRPNLLQVKLEYKARPLNGIWAVPPYLHNGSVPSLNALLSPVEKRPAIVYLGSREYDPREVGYRNDSIPGGSTLDTSKPGNRNTGHEFRAGPKGNGVIGRELSEDERRSLIEYLKTL